MMSEKVIPDSLANEDTGTWCRFYQSNASIPDSELETITTRFRGHTESCLRMRSRGSSGSSYIQFPKAVVITGQTVNVSGSVQSQWQSLVSFQSLNDGWITFSLVLWSPQRFLGPLHVLSINSLFFSLNQLDQFPLLASKNLVFYANKFVL